MHQLRGRRISTGDRRITVLELYCGNVLGIGRRRLDYDVLEMRRGPMVGLLGRTVVVGVQSVQCGRLLGRRRCCMHRLPCGDVPTIVRGG